MRPWSAERTLVVQTCHPAIVQAVRPATGKGERNASYILPTRTKFTDHQILLDQAGTLWLKGIVAFRSNSTVNSDVVPNILISRRVRRRSINSAIIELIVANRDVVRRRAVVVGVGLDASIAPAIAEIVIPNPDIVSTVHGLNKIVPLIYGDIACRMCRVCSLKITIRDAYEPVSPGNQKHISVCLIGIL